MALHPDFKRNQNLARDWFNIGVGLVWQIALVAVPMYVVIQDFVAVLIGVLVIAATSLILKKNWYDKLERESSSDSGLAPEGDSVASA